MQCFSKMLLNNAITVKSSYQKKGESKKKFVSLSNKFWKVHTLVIYVFDIYNAQ